MRNFFDCIKSRRTPASDMIGHHRVMNCCHLRTIAIQLKRKLKWHPVEEVFVGDEEANALLKRAQREPYTVES